MGANLKQGDTLSLGVVDYGINGEGIAKYEGFVIFIPFAMKGEKVSARILHVKKSFAYAKLLAVEEASPMRVKPPCNRYEKCGGCDIIHIDYGEQLRLKRQNLMNTLSKGGVDVSCVSETVASDKQFAYRNKGQLPFGTVNGKLALGFFQEGTHKIVPVTKCFLHGEWLEKLILEVKEFAEAHGLTAYDEATGKGLLRHLVARTVCGKLSVILVINGKELPFADELSEKLRAVFGGISLYFSENTKKTNVILGEKPVAVYEGDSSAEALGIKFNLNPLSFLQVNDFIRDNIYSKVVEECSDCGVVVDVFSGIGLMGAILARSGTGKVYNIEIVPEAVADADKLAEMNNIPEKITNICGDAAEELPKLINKLKNSGGEKIGIILDPPRKGLPPEVISALNAVSPEKLIYISCNPATLARDLSMLNYIPYSIIPYDMFCNTSHLETLVCMRKKD